MGYFTKREKIIVISLGVIVAFISGFSFLNKTGIIGGNAKIEENLLLELNEDELGEDSDFHEENMEDHEGGLIMVHICGQVNNPGIIELESGSRVIDAVNLAGGLKKTADSDRINLARKLLDEEKVYIPEIGEEELPIEDFGLNQSNKDNNSSGGKININLSSKEELMTLSGIGEVTAQKILDYREENLFKTLDDIKNVSGIGDKKFEAIKEFITVK